MTGLKQIIKNIRPFKGSGQQWNDAMVEAVAKEYAREVLNEIQNNPNNFIDVEVDNKKLLTSLNANAWKKFGL